MITKLITQFKPIIYILLLTLFLYPKASLGTDDVTVTANSNIEELIDGLIAGINYDDSTMLLLLSSVAETIEESIAPEKRGPF